MTLADYDYTLPEHLVARWPSAARSGSRLLEVGADGALTDRGFGELPSCLAAGDLLVVNDTRVVRARLRGAKASGGRVEVLVERVLDGHRALAHLRASKTPRPGTMLHLAGGAEATVAGRHGDLFEMTLADGDWPALMARAGEVPLPPYLGRDAAPADVERYQTVYARHDGAVAAPTAGLHFDDALLERLAARGVAVARLTLHVGAGTFQTIRDDDLDGHVMHAEWMQLTAATCDAICRARAAGGRVVAVGTTVVRALETAALDGPLAPCRRDTRLFIRPGFRFRVVDAMITNFHLPRTTLMLLVAAFAGRQRVLAAYRHAVAREYRFYSYGDAMLLHRDDAGP